MASNSLYSFLIACSFSAIQFSESRGGGVNAGRVVSEGRIETK